MRGENRSTGLFRYSGMCRSLVLPAIKRWLLFVTRFLLFSCLLSALWHGGRHGGGGGGCYFFIILAMTDEESAETPVIVASQASQVVPSNQTTMNHPPLPQVNPPPPRNLADCSAKKWKLWKQAWPNFAIVSKILTQDDSYEKAVFLCTIGQSALEIYNTLWNNTSDNPDKVDTIIAKFNKYFMRDVNKT